jgi:integrase
MKGVHIMASIEKRGEHSYRITVIVGRSEGGKVLRKAKTIEISDDLTPRQMRQELEKQSVLFENEVKTGTYYEPSRMTVNELIKMWLVEKEPNLKAKTYYRYRDLLIGRVSKGLGHLKVDEVKPLHLMDFYNGLKKDNHQNAKIYMPNSNFWNLFTHTCRTNKDLAKIIGVSYGTVQAMKTGKPTSKAKTICDSLNMNLDDLFITLPPKKELSSRTIHHHHRVLNTMMNDAVRWGIMKENPCLRVNTPKTKSKEMNTLDEEGFTEYLSCLEKEPIKTQVLITLALVTGCRRGELCALSWNHISFEKRQLNVKQSVSYTSATGLLIGSPKTEASRRIISLPDTTINLLRQYRRHQSAYKMKIGSRWQADEKKKCSEMNKAFIDPDWIFTTKDGKMMFPDSLTSIFNSFVERNGLPDIRFHDLRHTACSMLLHEGVNIRAVASRLGHANPSVTMTVYAHALASADRVAAEIMEKLFKKECKEPNDQLQKVSLQA